MRGTLWSYITLLVLAIEVTTVAHVIYGAFDESASLSAAMNGERVSGVVNLLQASPAGTQHQYLLPRGSCALRVRPGSITFSAKSSNVQINYSSDYTKNIDENFKNKVKVAGDFFETECNKRSEKTIYFKRCEREIKVSLNEQIFC
ncbi:MAG: hypothetical protein HY513_05600 [Candidatus Aenigmarchaeota archaeon]|nr:hypothetical protein [Candidatus Aenigmarchaeota archaeon]